MSPKRNSSARRWAPWTRLREVRPAAGMLLAAVATVFASGLAALPSAAAVKRSSDDAATTRAARGVVVDAGFRAAETADRLRLEAPDGTPLHLCEDPACGLEDGANACAACQLFSEALMAVSPSAIAFEGSAIEKGVAVRLTSSDPEIADLLWDVAVARNALLEAVHRGESVPLCPACRANVQSFADLQIVVQRIPTGVLQVYTSSNTELVELLQAMVMAGGTLPL